MSIEERQIMEDAQRLLGLMALSMHAYDDGPWNRALDLHADRMFADLGWRRSANALERIAEEGIWMVESRQATHRFVFEFAGGCRASTLEGRLLYRMVREVVGVSASDLPLAGVPLGAFPSDPKELAMVMWSVADSAVDFLARPGCRSDSWCRCGGSEGGRDEVARVLNMLAERLTARSACSGLE